MKSQVKIYTLPGGKLPERKTAGAIGFDVAIRAVVSATEMDTTNPILRKTLFDFVEVPKDNPYIERHVAIVPGQAGNQLAYQMDPGESVLVGIGFVTEMEWPMFYFAFQRSGLATKWGISIKNDTCPIDSDYRGEAGVLVCNENPFPFLLHKDMRIAQVIFQKAIIPNFLRMESHDDLSNTCRGTGGFGSTGIK